MAHHPRIIRCPLVPSRFCINLFGTIWTRHTHWITPEVIRHERIHTAQMRELLYIPFYIISLLEWLIRLLRHRHWFKAYMSISFEREAYRHAPDPIYLTHRPHFAQWRTRQTHSNHSHH